jgi:hypothetical protein
MKNRVRYTEATNIHRYPNSTHHRGRQPKVTATHVSVVTENTESEAKQKFIRDASKLVEIIQNGQFFHIGIRSKEYDTCKSGHPSYKQMTNFTRTTMLRQIQLLGNTASRLVTRFIGLSARQIGQIRRHHFQDWRTASVKI